MKSISFLRARTSTLQAARPPYPKICIHGRWFEHFGFLQNDETMAIKITHRQVVVINLRYPAAATAIIPTTFQLLTITRSTQGFAMLTLQGRWLEQCGFPLEEDYQISNPAPGIVLFCVDPAGEVVGPQTSKQIKFIESQSSEIVPIARSLPFHPFNP